MPSCSRVCLAAWFLLVALVMMGCANKEEEAAKAFVTNYVSVLQDAYARANLGVIGPFTTDNELKKLFPVIQALEATGNSMRTEILSFKVEEVKVEDGKATVRTSERWRYWWIDSKSGVVTKPRNEEAYHLEYHLVRDKEREKGSWKIDSVRDLNQ